MTIILVDDNEPIDRALRRFKKELQKSGVMSELRRRAYHEKPSVRRKRKAEAAKRKLRRKMMKVQRRMDDSWRNR